MDSDMRVSKLMESNAYIYIYIYIYIYCVALLRLVPGLDKNQSEIFFRLDKRLAKYPQGIREGGSQLLGLVSFRSQKILNYDK